jgi:hypothetical protein
LQEPWTTAVPFAFATAWNVLHAAVLSLHGLKAASRAVHTVLTAGMAKPEEVADNVAVIVDMAGSLGHSKAVHKQAGSEALGTYEKQQQEEVINNSSNGTKVANGGSPTNGLQRKEVAAMGLSSEEAAVLAQIWQVLQPVKDVTWPVGLSNNRN